MIDISEPVATEVPECIGSDSALAPNAPTLLKPEPHVAEQDSEQIEISIRWALTGALVATMLVNSYDYPMALSDFLSQKAKVGCSVRLLFGDAPLDEYMTLGASGLTSQSSIDIVQLETDEEQARRLAREVCKAEQPLAIDLACTAILDFLSASCGERIAAKRRDLAVNSGLVQAVIEVLRIHHQSVLVQEAGWGALSTITCGAHEGMQSSLINLNVVPLLQATLREHPTEKKLKRAASATLSNIYRGRWSRKT